MQVNVNVSGSRALGITVRGGNEFGLGIYISRVDPGSAADHAGLKVLCAPVIDPPVIGCL